VVPDRCQRTAGRQALLALPTNELDGNSNNSKATLGAAGTELRQLGALADCRIGYVRPWRRSSSIVALRSDTLRPMWPTPAGAPAAAGISSWKVSRLI